MISETDFPGNQRLIYRFGHFCQSGLRGNWLDLYVVAILAVLSLALFWRRGPQPLVIYYTTAYTLGLVATAIYKGVAG